MIAVKIVFVLCLGNMVWSIFNVLHTHNLVHLAPAIVSFLVSLWLGWLVYDDMYPRMPDWAQKDFGKRHRTYPVKERKGGDSK